MPIKKGEGSKIVAKRATKVAGFGDFGGRRRPPLKISKTPALRPALKITGPARLPHPENIKNPPSTIAPENTSFSPTPTFVYPRPLSIVPLFLALIFLFSPAFAQFGGGTSDDPYLIYNATDLNNVRNGLTDPNASNLVYKQMAHIDLEGSEYEDWVPIGTSAHPFRGTYYGNGFKISRLKINLPGQDYIGLFGYADGAKLEKICLENVNVKGKTYVGGLIGYAKGNCRVYQCSASGTLQGYGSTDTGGLIGQAHNGVFIIGCSSSVKVVGKSITGGLLGQAYNNVTIINSFATGNVEGEIEKIGGLIGLASVNVTIKENCYATGIVKGASGISPSCVGGLVGHAYQNTAIKNCYAKGNIIAPGNDKIGGLMGYASESTIKKCYATGGVNGKSKTGGLIGNAEDSLIEMCYATGAVGNASSHSDRGGLIGKATQSNVFNSYAKGTVTGTSPIGGFIGSVDGATLSYCYSVGSVTGQATGGFVGAISGPSDHTSCFCNKDITGSSAFMASPRSGAEMRQRATFGGWNFDDIWDIDEGNDYPFFRVFQGAGTAAFPYQIWNAKDLNNVRNFLTKHFIQMAHIDFEGSEYPNWTPLGNVTQNFKGSYDGGNYFIKNLKCHIESVDNHCGLFGYISNASLQNIVLENASITTPNGKYIGALAGSAHLGSKVINCHIIGGEVRGKEEVGGLMGRAKGAIIEKSSASCSVLAFPTGSTDEYGDSVGGLVGYAWESAEIKNCYATGSVKGKDNIGGLIGNANQFTVDNCYAIGPVLGSSKLGGLIGGVLGDNGVVRNSFWNIQSTGQLISAGGGTASITSNMLLQSTFSGCGWDFTNIWKIIEKDSYPYFLSPVYPSNHPYVRTDYPFDGPLALLRNGKIAALWHSGADAKLLLFDPFSISYTEIAAPNDSLGYPVINIHDHICISSKEKLYLYKLNDAGTSISDIFSPVEFMGNAEYPPAISFSLDNVAYVPVSVHESKDATPIKGALYAIDLKSGKVKWICKTDQGFPFSGNAPVIGPDGTIYAGFNNNNNDGYDSGDKCKLYAISPNGQKKWSYPKGDYNGKIISSPAICDDGRIAFSFINHNGNAHLHILDNKGELLSLSSTNNIKKISNPSIGADGTIYYSCITTDDKGKLMAFYPTGQRKWIKDSYYFDSGLNSFIIGSDGLIYLGAENGELYGIDPSDGNIKWSVQIGGPIRSTPLLLENGNIYLCTTGSNPVFCYIQTDSRGMAKSSWPRPAQNNQNTGAFPRRISPVSIPDWEVQPYLHDNMDIKAVAIIPGNIEKPAQAWVAGEKGKIYATLDKPGQNKGGRWRDFSAPSSSPDLDIERRLAAYTDFNGKLWVAGGMSNVNIDTPIYYDLGKKTWHHSNSPMPFVPSTGNILRRQRMSAISVGGDLYILKGTGTEGANIYKYSMDKNDWFEFAKMYDNEKSSRSATAYYMGQIFFIGGSNNGDLKKTVKAINIQNKEWINYPDYPVSGGFYGIIDAQAVVHQGILYVFGGSIGTSETNSSFQTTELVYRLEYSDSQWVWKLLGSIPSEDPSLPGLSQCIALSYNDGIMIIGGMRKTITGSDTPVNSVYFFRPPPLDNPDGEYGTWEKMASMKEKRAAAYGAVALDGTIIVAGGNNGSGYGASGYEIFIPPNFDPENAFAQDYRLADTVLGQDDFYSRGNVAPEDYGIPWPSGVCFSGGRLFVSEKEYHRILVYDGVPTMENKKPINVIGQADYHSSSANRGNPTSSKSGFFKPMGIASDNQQFFVADSGNNRILVFDLRDLLNSPDENGEYQPSDPSAKFVLGQTNFATSNPGCSKTGLKVPTYLASNGKNLFVADSSNNRILVYDLPITNSNQPAIKVFGQPDFESFTSDLVAEKLSKPQGICIVKDRLFVVDVDNNRVQIFDIGADSGASALISIGQASTSENAGNWHPSLNDGFPSSYGLAKPYGIASDGSQLFVSDRKNNRVLVYYPIPDESGQPAISVLGQRYFQVNNQGLSRKDMRFPSALCIANGNLIVGDQDSESDGQNYGNQRVLIFSSSPWNKTDAGVKENLKSLYVSKPYTGRVWAVGDRGKAVYTQNGGIDWVNLSGLGTSKDLRIITKCGGKLVAAGDGVIRILNYSDATSDNPEISWTNPVSGDGDANNWDIYSGATDMADGSLYLAAVRKDDETICTLLKYTITGNISVFKPGLVVGGKVRSTLINSGFIYLGCEKGMIYSYPLASSGDLEEIADFGLDCDILGLCMLSNTRMLAVGNKGLVSRLDKVEGLWSYNNFQLGEDISLNAVFSFENYAWIADSHGNIWSHQDAHNDNFDNWKQGFFKKSIMNDELRISANAIDMVSRTLGFVVGDEGHILKSGFDAVGGTGVTGGFFVDISIDDKSADLEKNWWGTADLGEILSHIQVWDDIEGKYTSIDNEQVNPVSEDPL